MAPFIKQIEKISNKLKIILENYLNKDIYDNFKSSIQENIVEKIEKEEINDLMFRKLGVPRKSLNQMSLGGMNQNKKKGKNTFISPDKIVINLKKEKNPFQKAIYSPQQQGLVSENLLGYSSEISSNQKNTKTNYSSYTFPKIEDKKIKDTGLSMIPEKSNMNLKEDENRYKNKKMATTTTITNLNNMNVNNVTDIGEINEVSQKRIEEK